MSFPEALAGGFALSRSPRRPCQGQPGASRTAGHTRAGFVYHSVRSLPSCSMLQSRSAHMRQPAVKALLIRLSCFLFPLGRDGEQGEKTEWGQEGLREITFLPDRGTARLAGRGLPEAEAQRHSGTWRPPWIAQERGHL